jgi:hypothetical protein
MRASNATILISLHGRTCLMMYDVDDLLQSTIQCDATNDLSPIESNQLFVYPIQSYNVRMHIQRNDSDFIAWTDIIIIIIIVTVTMIDTLLQLSCPYIQSTFSCIF